MTGRLLAVMVMLTGIRGYAQDIGDFTRAPIEHEIDVLERPFVVPLVRGKVCVASGDGLVLPDVLIEIQGPDRSRKIRRAKTDQDGQFRINRTPSGTYKFKATLNGWQSVMGKIVVSKSAHRASEVLIEMHPGT